MNIEEVKKDEEIFNNCYNIAESQEISNIDKSEAISLQLKPLNTSYMD
jgi:hypothetical protein